MKVCSKCTKSQPEINYFVKDKSTKRLHAQCKNCYREQRKLNHAIHYEKYGDEYRERARIRRNRLKDKFRSGMLNYLQGKSCVSCGEKDIVTFELDHIDASTKLFSISQAHKLGYNWASVEKELKKCQVLCANCHKRKTAKQFGWYKSK